MKGYKNKLCLLLLLQFFELFYTQLIAQELEQGAARIYRSPEERREAGLGRQVTNWLQVSGLVEAEKLYREDNFSNDIKRRQYDRPLANVQLSFDVSVFEWLSAELIFDAEYDFEAQANENQLHAEWDEAFVEASFGEWGIKFGRQYMPFGEYYSHFVTGPILEFGETRADGLIVDYTFDDIVEISGFIYDSDVKNQNQDGKLDWGSSIDYTSRSEAIRFGLGYSSDLAESDERFLADDNDRYENRVSAWNAYLLVGFEPFEFTAEYLQANSRFREFDGNEDKPSAFNFELAFFPQPAWQLALRYEHSDEFSDEPRDQYGLATTWAPVNHFTITAEYLHGTYKNNFVLDDDDNDQEDRDIIAVEISVEF